MKKMIFKSKSEKDTGKLADQISNKIDNYKIICLYGDLGAGKTTFVKAFAKSLGIEKRVISPTYVFVREYELENKKFYHIDAYRLEDLKEDTQAIKEIFDDPKTIVTIEWAEKIKEILPERRIDIKFEYSKEQDERIIEVVERK